MNLIVTVIKSRVQSDKCPMNITKNDEQALFLACTEAYHYECRFDRTIVMLGTYMLKKGKA